MQWWWVRILNELLCMIVNWHIEMFFWSVLFKWPLLSISNIVWNCVALNYRGHKCLHIKFQGKRLPNRSNIFLAHKAGRPDQNRLDVFEDHLDVFQQTLISFVPVHWYASCASSHSSPNPISACHNPHNLLIPYQQL